MNKVVTIHQPSFFPWLGLLHKIKSSNLYVLLDNVQFTDNAYQHRNLFLDNQCAEHLLTIPINKKSYIDKNIGDILISSDNWQKKHGKFIYFNYKKHPFFDEVYPLIQFIYEKKYNFLIDVLIDSIEISFNIFNIETETVLASKLNLDESLKKEEMVIDILEQTGATIYLSGSGAKCYQNEENFSKKNIELKYQKFNHPIYKQFNSEVFRSGLACLDTAFNLGKEGCSKIIDQIL